jgi:hypothetical protein
MMNQNLAPQLFEDIPLRLEILSGPLFDHWEGDPVYYYRISFQPGMTLAANDRRRLSYDAVSNEYMRFYRQELPKPPYSFEPYAIMPDQEAVATMVATALDKWQQSKQS